MGVRTPASDTLSETPQPPPSYPPQLLVPTGLVHSIPGPALDGDPTKSRTLNGIQVSAQEIDDLFQMYVHIMPVPSSNIDSGLQLLPLLCPIPSHSRPASAAQQVLCTVTFPVLGHYWRRMSGLFSKSDSLDGVGS